MGDVVVPTLNNNDDSYTLIEWLTPAAGRVAAGDVVATVETSKAVNELTVDEDGYLSHCVAERTECGPGDVVGRVWASRPEAVAAGTAPAVRAQPPGTSTAVPVVTRPARELMERHGIAIEAVAGLGKPVVKRTDVEGLVAGGGDGDRERLGPHQQAVARTVALSHATIPDAFVVVKVPAGRLLRRQAEIAGSHRAFVGLPEQVIKAVGQLHATFPRFYCTVNEDLSLSPAPRADIGVTVDVGTGLFVPVLRDVAGLEVPQIAERLLRLRVRALRGRITEADLAGSHLTVALHVDQGIVMAKPVVFPGQVCTLSLTAPQSELALAEDGTVVSHDYFHVGMSFDHRVVNGRDASRFLTALRAALDA
ncbi:2-oxo acid dehydrogenase subunit E2 [Dactylosporangium roseum]|uniref:Dihydrolipoamide acetyltransferase component of pyruvate dehydrogenase complex n=1 Tax=Dactylosporangium roseum TaxID=47989 RepID=A0ABY5ZDB4_9ACTN|nr:2-oxo acid dehydrogenase subunit E2 [Dactylosporangium roseum]UWZ39412.1 2-oxo acid dehydrogenase subunit E2 [Dactylosporangium roseum]